MTAARAEVTPDDAASALVHFQASRADSLPWDARDQVVDQLLAEYADRYEKAWLVDLVRVLVRAQARNLGAVAVKHGESIEAELHDYRQLVNALRLADA